MHPRHETMLRAITALAATLAVCGALAARSPRQAPVERTLDSLFFAGRFDTLRVILPPLIHAAEVRGDSVFLGRLAFQSGRVEITLGHQSIASRDLDRAIRLTEASRDTVGLLPALNFKAFVLRDQGNFDAAMALFERELDLARRARVAVAEGNATLGLAYRDLRRGELEKARAGYWRAQRLFDESKLPYSITGGASSMALLYRALGHPDSVRYWLNQSLRMAKQHGYPMHELWSLNSLGLQEADEGRPELAVRYYQEALAIGRRIGFDRGQAVPLVNLALRWSFLGERDRSDQALRDALAVCRRAGFKDLETTTTISLGILNLEAGNYHQAASYFRSIVEAPYVYRAGDLSEAAHGFALALADMDSVDQAARALEPFVSPRVQSPDLTQQPYYEITYADLLRRQGRVPEALGRARAVRDAMDRAGRTDVAVSARLLESSCSRALGDLPGAASLLAEAMDSLEVMRTGVGEPEWREALGQHLVSDVIEACGVLLEYPADHTRAERVGGFYDALQRFRTRTLLERIHHPGDDTARIEDAITRPATLARLQRDVLQPGDLLLDFFAGREETYLFAVSADSCRLVTLPGERSKLADQAALYAQILSSPGGKAYSRERLVEMQRTLGTSVLGSVNDLLGKAGHVIVAPDGFFSSIAFGTLISGDTDAMLLDAARVTEVPSASVLEWSRSVASARTASAQAIVAVADGDAALRGAMIEVNALERRYRGIRRIGVTPGLLDTLAAGASPDRILHIAAHARVNDASPWQSGFELAAAPDTATGTRAASPGAPVLLRAWSIARARLPYQMAVLAGCETAGGRATNGEGVLGLTSAFLSAGVPVVVSSRWPVDDRTTAVLMHHFYDRLAAGETVASALRDAQLAVRGHRATAHPFYWAGFAVIGDGSRGMAPLVAKRSWGPWWLGVGALFLAGWVGWRLRRRLPSRPTA